MQQSNLVAFRGARLRASFPRPAARDRERRLGLHRPALTRAPRASDLGRAGVDGEPRRDLLAQLHPRTSTIVTPAGAWAGLRRVDGISWASRSAPQRVRGPAAGSPWRG